MISRSSGYWGLETESAKDMLDLKHTIPSCPGKLDAIGPTSLTEGFFVVTCQACHQVSTQPSNGKDSRVSSQCFGTGLDPLNPYDSKQVLDRISMEKFKDDPNNTHLVFPAAGPYSFHLGALTRKTTRGAL